MYITKTSPPGILLALISVLGLFGCATKDGPLSTGQYESNGVQAFLTPAANAQLKKSWLNDPHEVFGRQHVGSRDAPWVINFIALTESRGVSPCLKLRAIELRKLDLKTISLISSTTDATFTYAPKEYSEIWVVEACGVVREWRVLDDPSNPKNPLTVLLVKPPAKSAA